MDGFHDNNGVLVIGATNAAEEKLDEALLRSGRFDKHVYIPLPDMTGRLGILNLYANKVIAGKAIIENDVDLKTLARGTVGMSGADLFNIVNQVS